MAFPFAFAQPAWHRISRFKEPWLGYLCISACPAAESEDELHAHGITHVYSLMSSARPDASTTALYRRRGIVHHHVHVEDDIWVDIIRVARRWYRTLDRERRQPGARILVHCHAGMSRSASFVLYHLMRSWNMQRSVAYAILSDARDVISPNPGFRQQLIAWNEARAHSQLLCAFEAVFKRHK